MRSKFSLLALGAALSTALVFSLTTGADATAAPQGARGGPAGQWVGFVDFGGVPVPFITNATANGLLTQVDGTDQGLGGLAGTNSTATGRWFRTGNLESTGHLTWIEYVDTIPLRMFRSVNVTQWSASYLDGQGVSSVYVYDLSAGDDPSDPNGGTFFGDFSYDLKKVEY